VKFFNGLHSLSARAIVQGGTQSATPSVALTFNNASGFVATLTNVNTVGGPLSAINTTNGTSWTQGTHTLKLVGVNYACGAALANGACPAGQTQSFNAVSVTLFGQTIAAVQAAGTSTFTVVYDGTEGCVAPANCIDNYQSPQAGENLVIAGSVLSNGGTGPSGTSALLNGTNGIPAIGTVRADNVEPGAAGGTAPTVGAFPIWLTKSFAFASGTASGVNNGTDTGVAVVKS
jgi:hypothetical protein